MISDNDVLLHLLTRHTNLNIPYSDYLTSTKFPEQNTELLNTSVTIKYRDYYHCDIESFTIEPWGRPSDDEKFTPHSVGPEETDDNFIMTESFKVVRADAEAPYVLIGVNADYSRIIVNSSRPVNDNEYEFNTRISEYPVQNNTYIGYNTKSQYFSDLNKLSGITLRVDQGEPCYSVIMEYLDSGKVRFTLGDEHYSIMGTKAYSKTTAMNDDEVATFRQSKMKDVTPYGTV